MMSSTHYQINADSINVGGLKQTSASYKSEDTIGESATGVSGSAHYKVSAGYQAMWDYPPGLSFAIGSNSAPLGTLSTSAVSSTSTTFSVSTNASHGYFVGVAGSTLTSGGHTIAAMASPDTSHPGNEQFGINLVGNSSPSVGANPSGGVGSAASGYGTTNNFKYVSADTIANASIYSKTTNFTISYIGNIATGTAAGSYATNLTLVATAKF
jgi:hypothetical protein